MPVETNSGSSFESKSFGVRPRAAASAFLLSLAGRNLASSLRHRDALRAAFLEADFDGENAGAGLLRNVNAAFLRGHNAEFGEKKPRADHGMAGELQFFLRRENAQTSERAVFGRFLNEDGLGEIHFARDGEHRVVGEAVTVGDDGERVAFKSSGGENVERVEAAFHRD